ncbi:hypothetical protein J3R83DRAFT_2892 [Lanmaoa asiatica]|nr:hypothetical protein J3R83DRAFT_2892 [Lanmaoa asiatica]
MSSNIQSLMDWIKAWHYVMQWVKNEIKFIPLTQKLGEISNYKHEDWKLLFDQLFTHSEEDDVLGATATVETALRVHGLSFLTDPSGDVITSQNVLPGPSKDLKCHCRKIHPASDNLPFPKCCKIIEKGKHTQRSAEAWITHYLDLEAHVGEEEDDSSEEEENDLLIVPDGEDESSEHFISLPTTSLSRYTQAINAISQQYEFGGSGEVEDEEGEGYEGTDEDLEVLDDIGLWQAVGDWLSSALNFEYLMHMLDFQHGKYTKIGY